MRVIPISQFEREGGFALIRLTLVGIWFAVFGCSATRQPKNVGAKWDAEKIAQAKGFSSGQRP